MRKYPFSFSLMCVVLFISAGLVTWTVLTIIYQSKIIQPITEIVQGNFRFEEQRVIKNSSNKPFAQDPSVNARAMLSILFFEFRLDKYDIGAQLLLQELERNNLTLSDIDFSEVEMSQLRKKIATINALFLLKFIRDGGNSRANVRQLIIVLDSGGITPEEIGSSIQEINWMYCNPSNGCVQA